MMNLDGFVFYFDRGSDLYDLVLLMIAIVANFRTLINSDFTVFDVGSDL